MEVQTRRKSRSGEDLRRVGESEALLGPTKQRPATAGRRFARGHQIQPLSEEEEQERPTLPFNVWSSLRRPDPLTSAEDAPSTSHSLQRPTSGRAVRKVVPVEQEETPENTSVDLDIFTKATNSSTDPATGDIIQPDDDDGQDNQTDQQPASQSLSLLAPPQLAGEQHAYIPYSIAKETIAKICNEMKKMKERHVRIVDEIDSTYSEIEVETQQQFNNFVLRLKSQYSSKYATFKQVIELYQEELQKNKGYWQSTAESLAARNRELLQENQILYKNNKKGFEFLEAEKDQAINKVTEKVEREKKRRREECQKAVTMIRALQAQQAEEQQSANQVLEATKAEHHSAIKKHVAEIAALREELELTKKKAEQQTVQIEQAQLQKTEQSQIQKTEKPQAQKTVEAEVQKTVPVPEHKVVAQIEPLAASIQSSLKLKQKELDNLQHQLQSICHLIRSEAALRTAIGGVATSLQEQHLQLKNSETDLQQQSESWKADFRTSHSGAEPTEDDWSEDVREMNQKLLDTCDELASCTAKVSLIQMLRNVTAVAVPVVTVTNSESSKQPAAPVVTGEQPIVPSSLPSGQPMVEEYKEVIASLEKGNIELVSLNEQLSGRVTSLEKENFACSEELQRLRTEVQELKEGAVVAASQHIMSPGEEKKDEGALDEDHSDDDDEEKQETDEEELEGEKEDIAATPSELQASTSQMEIPSTDKAPEVTSPQSEAPASKPKPTRRPTTDNKSPAREPVKEKQARGVDAKGDNAQEIKKLREQLQQHKKQQQNDAAQIKALKSDLKSVTKAAATGGSNLEDKKELKRKEKEIKELVKQFEITKKNLDKAQSALTTTETELKDLKKSNDQLQNEFHRKQDELTKIEVMAKKAVEAQERVEALSKELKAQAQELKTTTENYNSERILRKKYYNMIEDMKGKIRVYCRARPLSKSEVSMSCQNVTESPDEYTINVHSSRGLKEFQFDRIFLPEHGQELVFEDTHNLVQSAVDGYNVCIFAYGQTGSGKTYTMIGGMEGKKVVLPGIAPRAFERIFQLANENKKKFSFKVSSYMLELYNDRLLDLFTTDHKANTKLDIKKDKKGMVFVQGSIVKEASTSEELYGHFEFGSQNRHTASTKMNSESSRSHLIIGIVIESTNLTTGTITKGKLSLVDLAGSERAAKTEASAEQLKEAQSINKSLSALGDVISALSSGQDFVPYRNNKLTMLMQDSLGGNAKTLMFVNISPADYNMDETVISLTYASRVKLITNDAQKNADNKEISKLKAIITKLRRGEEVDDEE